MPGMDYFHNSKSHWLNALRGYFNDLDWTVDNINDQDKTKFDNIYTWMKVNWKYRKFKGQSIVLRYEIFKRNLGLQLKRKNSHKDAYIERYEKTDLIRLDHWLNLVEHTLDSNKIKYANVMQEANECIKKHINL